MPNREFIREEFETIGIVLSDPESLVAWAKKRGLLGVYIKFRPQTNFLKGAWQVVRPGYKTDPNALAVNRGRKTFTFTTLAEKNAAEEQAKDWANYHFNNDSWRRIEGFGPDLFPLSIVEELLRWMPGLLSWKNRQSHKKRVK